MHSPVINSNKKLSFSEKSSLVHCHQCSLKLRQRNNYPTVSRTNTLQPIYIRSEKYRMPIINGSQNNEVSVYFISLINKYPQ